MSMFRNLMAAGLRRRDPLHGIHYVCDFDAKGRSNDEAEPMRSQWIDKATGKVIDLHNFAFAAGSGWNGYADDYRDCVILSSRAIGEVLSQTKAHFTEVLMADVNIIDDKNTNEGRTIPSYRVRVSGTFPEGAVLKYRDRITGILLEMPTPGVYVLPEVPLGNSNVGFQFDKTGTCDVTIEQLPLYPGALCSDGVDDYGLTREAINEEVGTMLAMLEVDDDIKTGSYFFNCGKNENANRLYCWVSTDSIPKMGLPARNITLPIGVLTRTPASPSEVMSIASYSTRSPSKVALYRLILIREQLDDAQVEFLKSKVIREYNEWCRDNGYDYAIING